MVTWKRRQTRSIASASSSSSVCRGGRPSSSSVATGALRSSAANQLWKVRICTPRPSASTRACKVRSGSRRTASWLAGAAGGAGGDTGARQLLVEPLRRGLGELAQPVLQALAHLAGGLLGERDR